MIYWHLPSDFVFDLAGLPTQSCYRILCLYCGCPPAYHEVRGSRKAAKRSNSDNFVAGEASSKKGKKNKKRLPKREKKAIGTKDVRDGGKNVLPRDD